jgi:hypothetical protein
MRSAKLSHRTHLKGKLDRLVAATESWRSKRVIAVHETNCKLLLVLATVGILLAESSAMTGQNLAQVSAIEYQLLKLRAESARFQREKDEQIRRQETENSRVASYNSELFRVVSEFQNHIADQHQHFVSCKKCRQLAKQMNELSRKIERGVR